MNKSAYGLGSGPLPLGKLSLVRSARAWALAISGAGPMDFDRDRRLVRVLMTTSRGDKAAGTGDPK